jgi:hypothetical protein
MHIQVYEWMELLRHFHIHLHALHRDKFIVINVLGKGSALVLRI